MPYYYRQQQESSAYQNMTAFLNDLLKAATNEAQAIDFYTRVINSASTEKQREYFGHALSDERVHYRLFTDLYRRLTNQEPKVPQFAPAQFSNFGEALERAIGDQLEAYEMYRDMYLSTVDPYARDILLRAFTDEIEHATRFIHLKTMV